LLGAEGHPRRLKESLVASPLVQSRLAHARESQTAFVGVSTHLRCRPSMCLDQTPAPVIGTSLFAPQETNLPVRVRVCRWPPEGPHRTAAIRKIKLAGLPVLGKDVTVNKKMTSAKQLSHRREDFESERPSLFRPLVSTELSGPTGSPTIGNQHPQSLR